MVGEKITRMDAIRAYCVALAAAITVLIASALGLPVSSTHIAVGAIFGVGLLRETLMNKGVPNPAVQPVSLFLRVDKLHKTPEDAIAKAQKRKRRRLVRRRHALGIATAWIVTGTGCGDPGGSALSLDERFCGLLIQIARLLGESVAFGAGHGAVLADLPRAVLAQNDHEDPS